MVVQFSCLNLRELLYSLLLSSEWLMVIVNSQDSSGVHTQGPTLCYSELNPPTWIYLPTTVYPVVSRLHCQSLWTTLVLLCFCLEYVKYLDFYLCTPAVNTNPAIHSKKIFFSFSLLFLENAWFVFLPG